MQLSRKHKDRRTRTLSAKLNDDELGRIVDAAQQNGVTVSTWVRDVVIRAATKRDVQRVILEEILAMRILTLNLLAALHGRAYLSSSEIQALIKRSAAEKSELAESYLEEEEADHEA